MSDRSKDRARVALLAVVIAIGVMFRFYGVADKIVWHDEVATRILAAGYTPSDREGPFFSGQIVSVGTVLEYQHNNPNRSVMDAVRDLAAHDPQHPPLYYVLARWWVKAWASSVGDGIGTLRGLSVLFSLACLPATYWLGWELSRSRRVAWTAVALAAVSPLFILYAQEAREYALWCLFIVLSNASLVRAIGLTRDLATPPRRLAIAWGAYALLTVLGLYTSFSTSSMILAQIAYIVVRERGRITRISAMCAGALTVSAALFLPWAINLLHNFEAFRASMAWSSVIRIPRAALWRILAMNVSRTVVDFWPEAEQVRPIAVVVAVTAATLVLAALAFVVRRTPRETSVLVMLLVLLPIGMLFLPDILFGGIRSLSGRYMMTAWIAVHVALALFLGDETRRFLGAREAILGALILVGFVSDGLNARQVAPWTKAVSVGLPGVAAQINKSTAPLVVSNAERHNRGNFLALTNILRPDTRVALLPIGT